MFKRSRRRIVAAILSVLVLLLFGTFCVIYLASYVDMTNENRQLLSQYVNEYFLPGFPKGAQSGTPDPIKAERGMPRSKLSKLELSTFYSVALGSDDQVLKVDTADVSTFTEAELTALARAIVQGEKPQGVANDLIYQMADKGSYVLVAFLDNTLVLQSAGALWNYTLLFGSITLVLMVFLARYLANRIVAPLEESYRRQKQFISDAGHELKTPVAVINANLELLSRQIGENPWLANIQYENERMSALIVQLLDLARTENVTPQMERIDLSRLVCGEMLPFETVAYENGLTIASEIAEDVYVYGNSVQLKQLTSILLDNAIRYSRRGDEVGLVLKAEKNKAALCVLNQGEAIAPEQCKHLFERFYRTDMARTGEGQQYGLGLAIAKAIMDTHKGDIAVRCHDGKVEFAAQMPLEKEKNR